MVVLVKEVLLLVLVLLLVAVVVVVTVKVNHCCNWQLPSTGYHRW